eukprot:TRINITY_DN8780_c0_g1_i1.p2 TRINITY_DN8780_c0_g1~~TRINITY_DN8780_c0_g1_i1.p2  ORF type:complete len:137 (-),score=21.56 TRINITY_DN8780_c0_g1_i1:237-647(-)
MFQSMIHKSKYNKPILTPNQFEVREDSCMFEVFNMSQKLKSYSFDEVCFNSFKKLCYQSKQVYFYTYKTRISIDANAISKFDFFYNLDLLDIFFLISSNINYSNSNIFLKLRANNNIIWIKNENFSILIEGKQNEQ